MSEPKFVCTECGEATPISADSFAQDEIFHDRTFWECEHCYQEFLIRHAPRMTELAGLPTGASGEGETIRDFDDLLHTVYRLKHEDEQDMSQIAYALDLSVADVHDCLSLFYRFIALSHVEEVD